MSRNKLWSISALSECSGHTRATIKKKLDETPPDGEIRAGNSGWLMSTAGPAIWGGAHGDQKDPEKMKPADRDAWYKGTERKIKIDIAKKQLVQADGFRLALSEIAKELIAFLESLPDIMERDCNATPDMISRIIEMTDVLRQSLHENVIRLIKDHTESLEADNGGDSKEA